MEVQISYVKCQSCNAKVNCGICGADITEYLRSGGFKDFSIDMNSKTLSICGNTDGDEIAEKLEEIGVFL